MRDALASAILNGTRQRCVSLQRSDARCDASDCDFQWKIEHKVIASRVLSTHACTDTHIQWNCGQTFFFYLAHISCSLRFALCALSQWMRFPSSCRNVEIQNWSESMISNKTSTCRNIIVVVSIVAAVAPTAYTLRPLHRNKKLNPSTFQYKANVPNQKGSVYSGCLCRIDL